MDADDLVFVEIGPSMSLVPSCLEQCPKGQNPASSQRIIPHSSRFDPSMRQLSQTSACLPSHSQERSIALSNEKAQHRLTGILGRYSPSEVKLPETWQCQTGNQQSEELITAEPLSALAQRMKISPTVSGETILQDEAVVSHDFSFAVDARY